jgi:hypothetical protein
MHQIPFAKNYKSKIAYIFRQFRIQNVFPNLHQKPNNTQKHALTKPEEHHNLATILEKFQIKLKC